MHAAGRPFLSGLHSSFHSSALCAARVTMDFLWLRSRRLPCSNQSSALTDTASSTMLGCRHVSGGANVNRRANRDCLDGREDVNLGPADTVQTSENKVFLLQGPFTPKTCSHTNPSQCFVVGCSVLETSLQYSGTRWLKVP